MNALVLIAVLSVGADMAPMPKEAQPLPLWVTSGVDSAKLKDGFTGKINGNDATREQIYQAFAASIPDFNTKRRITIIGDTAERKAMLEAIGKPAWGIVNAYPRDHWYVKQCGFIATGNPTVYITESDGTVVHRQDDEKEIKVALNKADPAYDPKSDPDLRKAPLLPLPLPIAPDSPQPLLPIIPGAPSWYNLLSFALGIAVPLFMRWRENRNKQAQTQQDQQAALSQQIAELKAAREADKAKQNPPVM